MVDEVVELEGDEEEAEELEEAVEESAEDESEAPVEEEEEAAPPNEPDEQAEEEPEEEEPEPEIGDPPGIITEISEEKFLKLRRAWLAAGKPRRLNAMGTQWMVFDNGKRFSDTGPPGSMGDYSSLSTSRK
jgi:hypothetical protein